MPVVPGHLSPLLRSLGLWRRLPPPWRAGQVVAADPPGSAPWRRALAATGSAAGADGLARVWHELSADEQDAVRRPEVRLARVGRQVTERTCGPAVLTMLAAMGDPLLALWLATGRVLPEARPAELATAPPAALRRLAGAPPQARFAALHRVVHRAATSRAVLGAVPWPESLGTPPWALARTARFLGVRWTHAVVDDTDGAHLADVRARVGAALDAGIPVPLLTGGDRTRGWQAAVPRHVVLAVPGERGRPASGLRIWEPARGAVLAADDAVLAGGTPHHALGGWSHLVWVVLPA